MSNPIITSQQLCKSYHDGETTVRVLSGIDLTISSGERVAIIGPSGSGKSTLLHLLGGLDKASTGQVLINGQNWQTMQERQRCQLRNKHLGFVYQFHHLLPEFTALENVAMPLLLGHTTVEEAMKQADALLNQVGLGLRKTHKPAQLSGGERQRVAIARALVHQPDCVLADEPTGNLDQATAGKVFDLMLDLNEHRQTALVIVTHDEKIAKRMDKVWVLHQGTLSLTP